MYFFAISQNNTSGWFQVYFNGHCDSICDIRFDIVATDVSCHQLGYDDVLVYSTIHQTTHIPRSCYVCLSSTMASSCCYCTSAGYYIK